MCSMWRGCKTAAANATRPSIGISTRSSAGRPASIRRSGRPAEIECRRPIGWLFYGAWRNCFSFVIVALCQMPTNRRPRAMTRYYFHLKDGADLIQDLEGSDLGIGGGRALTSFEVGQGTVGRRDQIGKAVGR